MYNVVRYLSSDNLFFYYFLFLIFLSISLRLTKKRNIEYSMLLLSINYCRRPESNRYGRLVPQDFKSCASASSATPADGWRRIRTFESVANRFTVCPLWPLGNPSIRVLTRMYYTTYFSHVNSFFLNFLSFLSQPQKMALLLRITYHLYCGRL